MGHFCFFLKCRGKDTNEKLRVSTALLVWFVWANVGGTGGVGSVVSLATWWLRGELGGGGVNLSTWILLRW